MRELSSLENFEKAKEYINARQTVSLSSFAEYMEMKESSIKQYLNLVCCRYSIKKRPLGKRGSNNNGIYRVN